MLEDNDAMYHFHPDEILARQMQKDLFQDLGGKLV